MRCKIAHWQVYTIKQFARRQYIAFFKKRKSCTTLRQHESIIYGANLKREPEVQK